MCAARAGRRQGVVRRPKHRKAVWLRRHRGTLVAIENALWAKERGIISYVGTQYEGVVWII